MLERNSSEYCLQADICIKFDLYSFYVIVKAL